MSISKFTIRVYGILIHENKLLITDEEHAGKSFTKLPGGGLEFGEGTVDCLIREFKEELDMNIHVISHFYTTDFFQQSAFDSSQQVISIYYRVEPVKHDFSALNGSGITQNTGTTPRFRWVSLDEADPELFTFPIDQTVVRMLSSIISD